MQGYLQQILDRMAVVNLDLPANQPTGEAKPDEKILGVINDTAKKLAAVRTCFITEHNVLVDKAKAVKSMERRKPFFRKLVREIIDLNELQEITDKLFTGEIYAQYLESAGDESTYMRLIKGWQLVAGRRKQVSLVSMAFIAETEGVGALHRYLRSRGVV